MKTPKKARRTGIYLTKYTALSVVRSYIDIVENECLIKSFVYTDDAKRYVLESIVSVKTFDEAIRLMIDDSDSGEIKTRKISETKAFELLL